MKQFSLLLALLFLASCHKTGSPTQVKTILIAPSAVPSILFLQVKVSQKEDMYEAKILNRMEVAGILDRDARGVQLIENQWLVSFFDSKNKLIDQITLPNPLEENFEVADDKGQFKNVEIKKVEAEFFFRVPNNPLIKTLQVEQILPILNKKKLFSLTF
jgi:hypothetical protein